VVRTARKRNADQRSRQLTRSGRRTLPIAGIGITYQTDHAADIEALRQQVTDQKEQVRVQEDKWDRTEEVTEINVAP